MSTVVVPLLVLAGLTNPVVRGPSCQTGDPIVEQVVAAKARELQGTEKCQFRLYHTAGDVDGDGVRDFLLVFLIEGVRGQASRALQFLVVLQSSANWKGPVVQVGERGIRDVKTVRVEDGVVVMVTDEHGPDAQWNPNSTGELRFRLAAGQLTSLGPVLMDCETQLKTKRPYKDWHRGPQLAFNGQIVFRETYSCKEGTCFRADMTFEHWSSEVNVATGFWKGSHIEFRRYVDSQGYVQSWKGECTKDSVNGTWSLDINAADNGSFWIHY